MFVSLGFAIVYLYQYYKDHRSSRHYMALLRYHLQHASLVLRHVQLPKNSTIFSPLVQMASSGWTEDIIQDDGSKQLLAICPKLVLRLEGWVSYLDSQDIPALPSYPASDFSYILFETQQAPSAEDYLERSFSMPANRRVKVADCVEPIAWKSGFPFGIVARCSLSNLTKLMKAFTEGTLCLDDMLDLHQMMSVDLEGSATHLLQSTSLSGAQSVPASSDSPGGSNVSIRQTWEKSQGEHGTSPSPEGPEEVREAQEVVEGTGDGSPERLGLADDSVEIEDDNTDLYEGSNESLASSLADFHDVHPDVDHFAQTVEEVVALEGEVISEMMDTMAMEAAASGDGVGGESLSGPIEELAPEALTPMRRQEAIRRKPPNVLIYCGKKDSARQFEGVKTVVQQCLSTDRYVVYHLRHDQVLTTPWFDNTVLLILASEKAYDGVDLEFLKFFQGGGMVVSFGCMFDEHFVERVQTSSSPMSVLPLSYKQWRDVSVICSRFAYKNNESLLEDVTLRAIGMDKNSGYPVLMEANQDLTGGVAVLSQVHLDKDPMELAISLEVYTLLKKANLTRFQILTHLITSLGLSCERKTPLAFTPAVLIALKPGQKEAFLKGLEPRLNNGVLRSHKQSVQLFESAKDVPTTITADLLPLVTNAASATGEYHFSVREYQRHLGTRTFGQVVIYGDVMTTTMNVFDGMMFCVPRSLTPVAIAGRQTAGSGRGGNAWISPQGTASFSLLMRLELDTALGQRLSFLQHIASLAVVQAVRTLPGYERLDLRLKWPNDIYFGSDMKIGGVLVVSSLMQKNIHANIGIGVNVDNKDPTICINDIIRQYNIMNAQRLKPMSREMLIARTIAWMESLVDTFQEHGQQSFLTLYYERWLHSNAKVRLKSSDMEVKVTGLDPHGYLAVQTPEGSTLSLHPDGNSFDMMKGLIAPKVR